MSEKYYLIYNSDGDTYIHEYDKQELIDLFNMEDGGYDDFMDKIEKPDTNYWGTTNLIIKGKIVVPIEKKIVIERDLE